MPDSVKPSKQDYSISSAEIPAIYFSNAVKEVVHTMLGLELSEIKAFSDNYDDVSEQITGLLMMAGELNIMISLGMSKTTAGAIVVYMTGMQRTELRDDELGDGIAELVNMIAGSLKTKLAANGHHFKVLFPFVVSGDNYSVIQKSKIDCLVKRYRAGSIDFLLKVFFYVK